MGCFNVAWNHARIGETEAAAACADGGGVTFSAWRAETLAGLAGWELKGWMDGSITNYNDNET